jgi:hypothetical protein
VLDIDTVYRFLDKLNDKLKKEFENRAKKNKYGKYR